MNDTGSIGAEKTPGRLEVCATRVSCRAGEMRSMADHLHNLCDRLGVPYLPQTVSENAKSLVENPSPDGMIPTLEAEIDTLSDAAGVLSAAIERISQVTR